MSLGIYAVVFVVMVLGSTMQSSVGMGQGLITAPLFRLLEPELLPGPIVVASVLTSVVLAMRNSKRTDVPEVVPAIMGRFIGSGIAIALLAALSERGLTLAIGVIVLSLVALRVVGLKIPRSPVSLGGTGVVSGVSGTIAALGGAPMGLLYEQHARARDFRGPMGVFLAVGSIVSLVLLVIAGELDSRSWMLSLTLIPPLVIGWILARWVTPIVDRGLLGPAVLVVSSASALALIISEVL